MKRFFILFVGLFLLWACEPDPVLTLSTEDMVFSAEGGSQSVTVTANNTWNILLENESSFIKVSPLTGTENGYFTVTVSENGSGLPRNGQFMVICSSHDRSITKVVHVSQECPMGDVYIEGIDYDPPREEKLFSAEGGTITFSLTATAPWTFSCAQSDVTLDLTSGAAGSFSVTATVPPCPVFEGRSLMFKIVCRTIAGGVEKELGVNQAGGIVICGGETYHAVPMRDGKWWLRENLRHIPAGLAPSADANAVDAGIWYPLVIDELTPDKATVKFSQEDYIIKANGYLYSTEVALGLKPGDLTAENAASFEGAQGICPNGWHIPTKADIIGLVGKTADKDDTYPNAPYFDAGLNGGNGSAALLDADGFNAWAWGAVSIANTAAVKGTMMGAIKAYQHGMNTGYIAGSTVHQVTTNEDGSLKNIQFVALMPNMNTGTYNGAWNNYRNGVSVRCVKNN